MEGDIEAIIAGAAESRLRGEARRADGFTISPGAIVERSGEVTTTSEMLTVLEIIKKTTEFFAAKASRIRG